MIKIGLFIKEGDKKVLGFAKKFIGQIDNEKYELVLFKNQAKSLGLKISGTNELQEFKKSIGVISIGGDGTMLRCARIFSKQDLPILGINLGRRGFLTEVQIPEAEEVLSQIQDKKFTLDQRIMLSCSIERSGKTVAVLDALNDIVIGKSGIARIIKLEASANNRFLTTYAGDGLIISTPTGSTGHNLSAGGPIIDPELSVIVLTAICSLSISNRSIIVPADKKLVLDLSIVPKGIKVMVTSDGQEAHPLKQGDKIIIKKSSYSTKFIRFANYNFFSVLKEKIGWAG